MHRKLVTAAASAAMTAAAVGGLATVAPWDHLGEDSPAPHLAVAPARGAALDPGDDLERSSAADGQEPRTHRRTWGLVGGSGGYGYEITDPYGNPVDPFGDSMIVGGGGGYGYEITDPYGNPVDPFGDSAIVGGPWAGSLWTPQLPFLLDSQNDMIDTWLEDGPDSDWDWDADWDWDGVPNYLDANP